MNIGCSLSCFIVEQSVPPENFIFEQGVLSIFIVEHGVPLSVFIIEKSVPPENFIFEQGVPLSIFMVEQGVLLLVFIVEQDVRPARLCRRRRRGCPRTPP